MPPNLLLFFGAGSSKPLGIPTSRELYADYLKSEFYHQAVAESSFASVFDQAIRECGIEPLDIEAVMSVLGALASKNPKDAILRGGKPTTLFRLGKNWSDFVSEEVTPRAGHMLDSIKAYIRDKCENYDTARLRDTFDSVFNAFVPGGVQWTAGLGNLRDNVSIGGNLLTKERTYAPACWCFTTNYDCALEGYFEDRGLTAERGFEQRHTRVVLSREKIHQDAAYKLIKLHGSVDMLRTEDGSVILSPFYQTGRKTASGKSVTEEVLIFPTQEKELFRFPFIDFFNEFLACLRSMRIWVFVGFSFSDEPVTRLIISEASPDKKMIVVSPEASRICENQFASITKTMQIVPLDAKVGESNLMERLTSKAQE